MCKLEFLIVVITLSLTFSVTSGHRYFCPDYRPQRSIDIEKIKGLWNVVELIAHEESSNEEPNSFNQSEACSTFKIEQETENGNFTIVNDVGNDTNNYFYASISNQDPGLWMVSGPYDGPESDQSARVINGNAQVLKAVADHLVLTFCTEEQESETEVYSFVLTRNDSLSTSPEFIKSIHDLLRRRKLELLYSTRFLCNKTDSEMVDSEMVVSSASLITSFLYLQIILIALYKFF